MLRELLLISVLTVLLVKPVSAVPVASDSASDAAYAFESGGAWKGLQPDITENAPGMDNGGFGFLPWNFVGGLQNATASPYGTLNHFIDGVDFAHSTFNNLGAPAFGLTNANIAFGGFTARATRVFSQPLAVGGTFSVEFDNPLLAPLQNNDETGYVIRLNSGGGAKIDGNPDVHERLGFFAFDGFNQGHWNRTDSSGAHDTGLTQSATASGARFRVTLQSAESYLFEILPLGSGSALYSASGSLASPDMGNIDTLEIVMFGNGSGNGKTGATALQTGQRELFFDNMLLDNPQQFPVGDYNHNGVVDAADYVVWRDSMNHVISIGDGADGNRDGIVNQLDYEVWKMNFGATLPGGGMGVTATVPAVPEPASLALVILTVIAIATIRRL